MHKRRKHIANQSSCFEASYRGTIHWRENYSIFMALSTYAKWHLPPAAALSRAALFCQVSASQRHLKHWLAAARRRDATLAHEPARRTTTAAAAAVTPPRGAAATAGRVMERATTCQARSSPHPSVGPVCDRPSASRPVPSRENRLQRRWRRNGTGRDALGRSQTGPKQRWRVRRGPGLTEPRETDADDVSSA